METLPTDGPMTVIDNSHSERQKIHKARYETNLASAARLDKKYLEKEAYLSTTKWFDYKFMPPADATDLFKQAYQKAYKAKWRETQDGSDASLKEGVMRAPIRGLQVSEKANANQLREYTSLWVARQRADELGIPYPFFIEHVLEAHMRNGYTKIPRPNQLAAGPTREKILMKVSEAWLEWLANSFTFSRLPQYMNQAYRNHPAQNDHRNWVLAQLKIGRPFDVGRACFIDQVLPEALAIAKYDEERLSQARDAVARETAVPFRGVAPLGLLPSCFGLPHAFEKGHPICSACPHAQHCEKMDAKGRCELVKKYGFSDPRAAKKREQDRNRQRKLREKKRARAAAIGAP